MAIATDASTNLGSTTATSLTAAHVCTGSNLILFVGVIGDTSTDDITGVTYNSVAMTQVGTSVLTPSDRYIYLYRLTGPSTGSNNVVISAGSSHIIQGVSASYTGAAQSSPIDVTGSNTGSSVTSLSKSLTTTVNNDWTIAFVESSGGNLSAGASTTLRRAGTNPGAGILDSNAAITPAGSTTLNGNNSGTANMSMIMAAFKPFGAVTSGGFFKLI